MDRNDRQAGPRAPLAVLATALAALAVAAPAARGEAGDGVAARAIAESAAEVRDYWTAERVGAAEPPPLRVPARPPSGAPAARAGDAGPAGLLPSTAVAQDGPPTASPQRLHGKVFFSVAGGSEPGDYVCSGTVVRSPSHTVVLTAGHCVNDAQFGGGFATNWLFVPGYRDKQRPFGSWPATELLTTPGWRNNANLRYDAGAAVVARSANGEGIEDVLGGYGIAFDQPRTQQFAVFGYPAVPTVLRPEFDGQRLHRCDTPRSADDLPPGGGPPTMQVDCDMTGGSSGGGWVVGGELVNGVTSYGYELDPTHLYGPYFGGVVEQLHREAGGKGLRCAGAEATNVGTAGSDELRAALPSGAVFMLLGGEDRALGGERRDRACGGGGADRLRGRARRDRLHGGDGDDVLVGGIGFDSCNGGRGRDRARGCEVERRVP